ncbi:hypothetical protein H8A87_03115 [Xenorhabdus sp. VLS]|uniref:Uncharacterized protein n=2 Tax=Xenorhabdus lircayensis TaxID=2763499 RepID=A0ABS0U1L7_9GAMM|nr:hypothetical protein [Xenorhabdus lircayensis]
MKFKHHGNAIDIGEIPVNFTYRNIETAFRFLSQQANYLSSIQHPELNCLSFFNNHRKEEKNTRSYGDCIDLISYLQHIYRLNLNGNYHNYASASDIARLVILYMEGGIYLDTDVELSDQDIRGILERKSARFSDLYLQSDMGIGDSSGLGWYSGIPYNEFGNAIIASLPQSKKILNLLLHMATMMKRHHLSIQINQSSKANEINKIKRTNKSNEIDKRIDLALKLQKSNHIHLNMKCSMQDPVWRTGLDKYSNDNSELARQNTRIDYTMRMTGPSFIDDNLNPKQKRYFPQKYKLMSKYQNDGVFKDVDDAGDWACIKKKYSDEDPFS